MIVNILHITKLLTILVSCVACFALGFEAHSFHSEVRLTTNKNAKIQLELLSTHVECIYLMGQRQ